MIKFFRPKQNKVDNDAFKSIHKVLKVIVINLLFLIFLFLFLECVFGFLFTKHNLLFELKKTNYNYNVNDESPKLQFLYIIKELIQNAKYFREIPDYYFDNSEFRKPSVGAHYNGDDIILAGCSYAYGYNLELKDTFGAVLTKFFPEYKVYNIGLNGASPRETLYILRNCEKYQNQNVLPSTKQGDDVKFFIYTAIPDSKNRLFINHRYRKVPLFKIQKSKNREKSLKYYESNNPLYKTLSYKFFTNNYIPLKIFDKYTKNLFTLYIKEIKKEVDKIYPNAKLVLFVFYDNYSQKNEFDEQEIENLGIKVIELNKISKTDFAQEKYRTYCYHPNGKAWREIVPLLGKELDL